MQYLSKFYFSGFGGISVFIVSTLTTIGTWFGPLYDTTASYSDIGFWLICAIITFVYVLFQIRNYHMVKNNIRIRAELSKKGYSEVDIHKMILNGTAESRL